MGKVMRISEIAYEDMREELELYAENERKSHNSYHLEYETWVAVKLYVLTKENTRLNRELKITQRRVR